MSISFSVDNKGCERYQVRIMRHGKRYSKCFSCKNGKRGALKKAEEYERRLIEFLDAEPLTSAGRHKGKPWEPYILWDNRYQGYYVAVGYRKPSGYWGQAVASVGKHGLEKATKLAIERAKKLHNPHPDYIPRKKMPSKQAVRLALS